MSMTFWRFRTPLLPVVAGVVSAAALTFVVGCGSSTPAQKTDPAPTATPTPSPAAPPPEEKAPEPKVKNVRLLLTTDEHGWMEPLVDRDNGIARGGLQEALAQFKTTEDLDKEDVLLLSAGDMWTGPFEATILEGAPMVQAFNEMGYIAAAVGNHEYDFGTEVLAKRQGEAKFPFLAANLVETASGAPPPWVTGSLVHDAGDLKVGIIGLTNVDAPTNTDPRNIVGLQFTPYADALKAEVPKVKAAGAELVVVLMHDGLRAARSLLPTLRSLGVHVVAAGHAHNPGMFVDDNGTPGIEDDIVVCNSGAYLRSYCRINVSVKGGVLHTAQASVMPVERPADAAPVTDNAALQSIIADAHKKSDAIGAEVLGSAEVAVRRKDGALGQFIVDTWREALPYADIAITNDGGVRQDLPKGKLRLRDVRSVLPFNNYLLVVELTFEQLKATLENPQAVVSGMSFTYRMRKDGTRRIEGLLGPDGRALDRNKRFKVIINDFMYRGGDHFSFRDYDPEPEETATDWREPVLRHLRALKAQNKKLKVVADERAKLVE